MKRLAAMAVVALGLLAAPATAAHADEYGNSLCQERPFMCLDPLHSIGANGTYTGHDEPTVQFSSHRPGTGGRHLVYYVTLPKNPKLPPSVVTATAGALYPVRVSRLIAPPRVEPPSRSALAPL